VLIIFHVHNACFIRGKGWKVEEHSPSPPSAFSWLRDISQLEIDGMVQMITARGWVQSASKASSKHKGISSGLKSIRGHTAKVWLWLMQDGLL